MGEQGLICGWHDKYRGLWGHQPIRLGHQLDKFGTDGLASLIESYPREHFSIVQTSDSTQRRLWREGELGGLLGREVIEAVGRRAQIVSLANGLLRHRFGWQPRSRSIEGPSYWAKAFLQKVLRNSSWIRQARLARRAVKFQLDRGAPGAVVNLIT
jgi:hypothetical protein